MKVALTPSAQIILIPSQALRLLGVKLDVKGRNQAEAFLSFATSSMAGISGTAKCCILPHNCSASCVLSCCNICTVDIEKMKNEKDFKI